MGLRIDAQAVDVVALGRVLERPLWRILLDVLAEHPDDEPGDVLFSVYNPSARERYHVVSRRGITRNRLGQKTETVDEDYVRREPFLQQSALKHFTDPEAASSMSLEFLLRDLTHADERRYVVPITSGYYPLWMPSAIEGVGRTSALLPSEVKELADDFGRINRGYRFGELPLHPERPPTYDVPGISLDDSDNFFAVFNESECRRLGLLTARVAETDIGFPVPKYVNDDSETWNAHVRDRLREFARLRELQLPNLRLVTFIG